MQTLDSQVVGDLLRRLGLLTPETRGLWGKMNAHQMVCHLNDSYALAMSEKTEWEWMRWGYLHADHHLRQFGL